MPRAAGRPPAALAYNVPVEIEENPHEEILELELFYQLKGFSPEESRSMAERIHKEPKQFLRTLVHEELGLSEENFPNPWRSTVSAAVSTAIGGFIPIIPFFFTVGMPAAVIMPATLRARSNSPAQCSRFASADGPIAIGSFSPATLFM